LRLAVVLISFLACVFIRDVLGPWLFPDHGFVLFLPAVILATLLDGLLGGITVFALSAGVLWYFFLPPYYSFSLTGGSMVGLGSFTLAGGVSIALVHRLRIALDELHIVREKAEELASQREQAESRIAADLRHMSLLNEVGNRFVRDSDDVNKRLNEALDTAIAIAGANKGNIQQFDPVAGALTVVAQRGFKEPFLAFFTSVRDDAAACAVAMHSAKQVIVEDVMTSDIFVGQPSQKILTEAGVRAVISTPVASSTGKTLGMISVHFSAPHAPEQRALRFIELLARQTTDYLERRDAKQIEKSLNLEVQHRSHNLLAVVQAIATQSLAG
jgi:K+-sensing histidine kinase KdpD